jgi:hypothetical protein
MPRTKYRSLQLRALLTETLPYEVPVIFSNDRFHASFSAQSKPPLQDAIQKTRDLNSRYTVPYSYGITKDRERTTELSIVHPLHQLRMADFYEMHSGAMLFHCNRSEFSLRRPVALASPFSPSLKEEDDTARSGIPELLASAGEPDPSHMTSYFVYGKYNLLGKFIGSREYVRLEERHPLVRTIDISKCFYNIYTHSITWAVKNKPFSKINKNAFSFEGEFDALMQKANYNETNGIVVGPEMSRIFAEIILQDVDEAIRNELRARELIHGRDYDIRRYVDDYFVFSSSQSALDLIEECIRRHLQRYKLYANEKKIATSPRPFVTNITIARDHISAVLADVASIIRNIPLTGDPSSSSLLGPRSLRSRLGRIRLIVAEHQIQFANVTGWLLSRLRRLVLRCISLIRSEPKFGDQYASVIVGLIEAALYVCSVDLRVRTTYALCQLVSAVNGARDVLPTEQYDLAHHLLSEGRLCT